MVYTCQECDYITKQKGNLKQHLWRAHGVGRCVIYECSACEYSTKRKGNLQAHLWARHNIGRAIQYAIICAEDNKRDQRTFIPFRVVEICNHNKTSNFFL